MLFSHSFRVISKHADNLLIGENTLKNQKFLQLMGIHMKSLSEQEYYPGCRLCAAYMPVGEMILKFEDRALQMEQKRKAIKNSLEEKNHHRKA